MANPKPNIKLDLRIKKLREEKKMTFRAIGDKLGMDVKTVFRQYKRSLKHIVRKA